MLHGRKGFDRVVWACKNALNEPVTWLFHDYSKESKCRFLHGNVRNEGINKASVPDARPIAKHHPLTRTVNLTKGRSEAVLIPPLDPSEALQTEHNFEQWTLQLYEWLSLVSIHSPRICPDDKIDPFLSRYQVPENGTSGDSVSLTTLTWKGLIPATWVRNLMIELRYAAPRGVSVNNGTTRWPLADILQ